MAIARWLMGALCACLLHSGSGSQEIIQKLTTGFGKALDQCKAELNLGDHILQDFMNYWREEYDLLNSDMGCAIMCMAAKHDLITEDMKLHHEKTHEFAKSHGADDELAKQLVQMIHGCEKQVPVDVTDDCLKTLEIAKCFRTKIHELKWAPSMETILEEVMADI